MAYVYIIYSGSADRFYIGSCLNLEQRLVEHNNHSFPESYTKIARDWQLFWSLGGLKQDEARAIEGHIKAMKSRVYIDNLKKYPEMTQKLRDRFCAGSSR
jgi:putative endonuclease